MGDADFASFEDDYYSVSEDTLAVRGAISELEAGGSFEPSTKHCKPAGAQSEMVTDTEASNATNPNWLTQREADDVTVDLEGQNGAGVSGLYLVCGHPTGINFTLLFCFGGKVERKHISRDRPGSTFTIENKHVSENKTLQGFILFLQSDGNDNPLPCALSQVAKGGGGSVVAEPGTATETVVNPHFLPKSPGFETPSSIRLLTPQSTQWVPDKDRKTCAKCSRKFTTMVRKHHCRICGEIFCAKCSKHKVQVNPQKKRSCVDCTRKDL